MPDEVRIPARPLPPWHQDFEIVGRICSEIERRAGTWAQFAHEVPLKLRDAIDEVIDTPRTGRFSLDECEKTEKTYLGTKVEILIRDYLGFPKGLLDLEVDGLDVDVKNTMRDTWMIPREAVGKACILMLENETTGRCSVGVLVCHRHNLTSGTNQDGKASVSSAGKLNIHWILFDHPYPLNVWLGVSDEVRKRIVLPRGGTRRLYELFKAFPKQPITRKQAEAIARQKDFMKRLRANGGVRDLLGPEGIALLSGIFDAPILRRFGVNRFAPDDFIAWPARTYDELDALRSSGHPYVTRLSD